MAIATILESLVLVGQPTGVVVIPAATPLTRLNYFDGKFLRASDLKAEQEYLRQLVQQSNQAGGAGVAYGYDVTLGGGDALNLSAGLAIDPQGRVLLLPQDTTINIQELIEKSRALQSFLASANVTRNGSFETCRLAGQTPAVNMPAASNLYIITISHAEALCGEEDVFGKLCEEACITGTDRPFAVEGLIVRAIPLSLQTPLPNSKAVPLAQIHLRSRVASAYFEDERRRIASLISKAGLEQMTWCLGADAEGGSGVPIGVIARDGAKTIFLDAWTARRERMDAPAKRYWQWRMMMRPWQVFLGQVLQFQCQLHDLFRTLPAPGGGTDPCGGAGTALNEAAQTIAELQQFYESTTARLANLRVNLEEAITFKGGASRLATLNTKLTAIGAAIVLVPQDRLLIRGGIVELPSAGYLPVTPGAALTINQQVRQMMGEGVDLRFCVVRPDYVAHALEEAQHMERISLLQGLDDANNKPQVDILVPNGEIIEQTQLSPGRGFEASVDLSALLFGSSSGTTTKISNQSYKFNGAARSERLPSGGGAAYVSAEYIVSRVTAATVAPDASRTAGAAVNFESAAGFDRVNLAAAVITNPRAGVWISLRCEQNIFELRRGASTSFTARAIVGSSTATTPLLDIKFNGEFQVTTATVKTGSAQTVQGHLDNARLTFLGQAFGSSTTSKTILLDLDATVTVTGGSAIEIVLNYQQNQFELSANWANQPMEVKAEIKTVSKTASGQAQEATLAAAALKENANVLAANNANHILALDALEVVAAALGDPNFADANALLLFPPPPKPVDELIVRGTLDWVLFHRRRNKQCQEEKPAPAPPPPTRTYQLLHVLAQSLNEAQTLRAQLAEGKFPANRLTPVSIIEFNGGAASLLTPATSLRSDWQRVLAIPAGGQGNPIIYGAIANRDSAAADGEALARARLDRLEDTLAPLSPLDPRALDDLLEGIPAGLPATGVDGVMVLFTLRQTADLSITKTDSPDPVAAGGDLTYTLAVTNQGSSEAANITVSDPLPGQVSFVSATASSGTFTQGNGIVTWTIPKLALGATATLAIVARVSPNAPAGVLLTNTATVSTANDPNPGNNTATTTTTVLQNTRTALVIFASRDNNQYFVQANNPRATVVFRNNDPEGNTLKDLIAGMTPTQFPINDFTLAVVTSPADAGAPARITAVTKALEAAGRPIAGLSPTIEALSDADKTRLIQIGVFSANIQEVIYLVPQRT